MADQSSLNKTVLVAGGAGYIGAHVCKALASEGYRPVVLDNLSAGHRAFVQWGQLVEAAVEDAAATAALLKEYRPAAVIDLAGSIEVAESVSDPLKYYYNNVAAKLGFLRQLKEAGVDAYIFSSTAAAYGEPEVVPIPENHPTQPKNPYGWSKLYFEGVLRDFHAAGGPRWMALRYFNAAGASPDGEIGEAHDPESHLIPRACRAALGTGPGLEVYGNDYPTPDGTAVRDYIHVMDLASAHVKAVGALLGGAAPAIYNLGNGVGTSIGEVLAMFATLGSPVPHQFKPRRAGDPARLVADSRAARAALYWSPHYDLEAILRTAMDWHKTNG